MNNLIKGHPPGADLKYGEEDCISPTLGLDGVGPVNNTPSTK